MTRVPTLVLVLFALVLLATLTPGSVSAQTPDGETPSIEGTCDDESGAAFGLCNAYCEAMDCHLAYDKNDLTSPSASEAACLKVRNKFDQLTAKAHVPCVAAVCPAGTFDCPCRDDFTCDGSMACDWDAICGWFEEEV